MNLESLSAASTLSLGGKKVTKRRQEHRPTASPSLVKVGKSFATIFFLPGPGAGGVSWDLGLQCLGGAQNPRAQDTDGIPSLILPEEDQHFVSSFPAAVTNLTARELRRAQVESFLTALESSPTQLLSQNQAALPEARGVPLTTCRPSFQRLGAHCWAPGLPTPPASLQPGVACGISPHPITGCSRLCLSPSTSRPRDYTGSVRLSRIIL